MPSSEHSRTWRHPSFDSVTFDSGETEAGTSRGTGLLMERRIIPARHDSPARLSISRGTGASLMRKAPASSHLHPQWEREADGPAGAAGTAVGASQLVPKGHFRTIPLLKMLQLKHIAGAIVHARPAPLAMPAVHTARSFVPRLFRRVAFVDLPEGQPFPDALTLRFARPYCATP